MNFPTHVCQMIGQNLNEMCRKFCPILYISYTQNLYINLLSSGAINGMHHAIHGKLTRKYFLIAKIVVILKLEIVISINCSKALSC